MMGPARMAVSNLAAIYRRANVSAASTCPNHLGTDNDHAITADGCCTGLHPGFSTITGNSHLTHDTTRDNKLLIEKTGCHNGLIFIVYVDSPPVA